MSCLPRRARRWLAFAGTILITLGAGTGCSSHHNDAGRPNPIVIENLRPGSKNWRIDHTPADGVRQQISGYASATSVNVGGSITLFITVNPVQTYSIEIFRIGYYHALGARLVQSVDSLAGVTQPACPMDQVTGMTSCDWSASYALAVPRTWTSGIYLAKLTNARLFQSYVIFTVRDDDRHAQLLYQQSVNTYQAYNNYPDDAALDSRQAVTGKSLYEGGSSPKTTLIGTTRAVKVSFDRPYAGDHGAGNFLDWEIYFVRWLEQSDYDVSYSTDVDTHSNGDRLLRYKGFLSVGHDEYWSAAMYDAATAARDRGVGLGFFGANAVYWQIRFEPSARGVPNRIIICYKSDKLDPVHNLTTTVRWRDPPVKRPEQQLVGVQFSSEQADEATPAPYVATNTANWVYTGTGMIDGDAVPGIVGYEADNQFSTVPLPTHVPGTYTLLSRSPYIDAHGAGDSQNSVVYQAGSGSWVFGAGSIDWSLGLSDDGPSRRPDARVARITANVLDRFIQGAAPPPAAPTLLRVVRTAAGSVDLAWTDGASDERNLILDRSDSAMFETATSISLAPNRTTYHDAGGTAGVRYYRVRTIGANGSSPYSNVVGAATISFDALVRHQGGLVSRWRLGEARGTVAVDDAGHDDGAFLGNLRLRQPGAIAGDPDTAIACDGVTGHVGLPSLRAVNDFSIAGWTTLDPRSGLNDNGNNALYGQLDNVRVLVRPGVSTAAYAGVWLQGTEYSLQPESSESNVGRWVQWVLTRSAGTLTLYRNGAQIAQRTDLPPAATASISGSIGAQGGSRYFLAGRVDEVAVYKRALSATEVTEQYTAAVAGPAP
jgi:hypothetical protein